MKNVRSAGNRILIFGNTGSGKSWLANEIAKRINLPIINFDQYFWEPGGFTRKRDKTIVHSEIAQLSNSKSWVMEGVFGELIEIALPQASSLIFLDKDWKECRDALLSRGPGLVDQLSQQEANESFNQLLTWGENYWTRSDLRSWNGHKKIFKQAKCPKITLKNRQETLAFLI